MSPTPDTTAAAKKQFPRWRLPLKIIAWTLMGLCLTIFAVLAVIATILKPENLTEITVGIANKNLRADVTIERVELTAITTFPYVELDVKNLTVTSRDTKSLDAETREYLPQWADTLLCVENMHGGLNVPTLLSGKLKFNDLKITSPQVNLLVVNDSVTNFDIFYPDTDTTEFKLSQLPEIELTRFEVVNPGPVRYYDAMTDTQLSASFRDISLTGSDAPLYTLDFQGNLDAPLLMEFFHFSDLSFALKGNLKWNQKQPYMLGLENFYFGFSLIKGTVSTQIDFDNTLQINSLQINLQPISIQEVLNIFPEEIADDLEIPTGIETSATAQIAFKLLQPFNVQKDMFPKCEATLEIPDSYLRWENLNLEHMSTKMMLSVPDDDLNHASLRIDNLTLQGPATNINISGTVRNLLLDPTFDSQIDINTALDRLPPTLRNLIPGTVKGTLTARATIRGSTSMFTPQRFQNLMVDGDVGLRNFYWLSGDTVNMVYVDRASFKFYTQKQLNVKGHTTKPLLGVHLTGDSLEVLQGNYLVNIRNLNLSLATDGNALAKADTTRVLPMGGHLGLGSMRLLSISDSIAVFLRDVNGTTALLPRQGDIHRPEFHFNLDMGLLAGGTPSMRLSIHHAALNLNAFKKPTSQRQKLISATADSIAHLHPELPPDSVIALARQMHRHKHKRYPRVHPQMIDDDSEVIDWGTSPFLRDLLLHWDLQGSLTSKIARLFTPYFPLRNRFENLNARFNNDSLIMTNIAYKAGRSDLLLSGQISNMKRAFTSKSHSQPLKINFTTLSDTIDVNQLANTTFAGSAFAAKRTSDFSLGDVRKLIDDNGLDSLIGLQVADAPEQMAPLLVPLNIDLNVDMRARNLLYSDLTLHNMSATLLAYRGALNLHSLRATSAVGNLDLSALYMGIDADSLRFGFGMKLNDFNLDRFLKLVPAVDSLAPVLRDFSGIISADIAATSPITKNMDLQLSGLDAAISLKGDSLVLIDPDTFKSMSKWLLFKDKKRNIIDHMDIQMTAQNGILRIYPFIFDIDRYRLGVQGYNDYNMNFDYHIAVLKSPIPFRFGINIKGNPDKYKIRLGGAKMKENLPLQVSFVDTTRVNLLRQIENVFRRGVNSASMASLKIDKAPVAADINLDTDTLTHADSLKLIEQGIMPQPPVPATPAKPDKKHRKGSKKHKAEPQAMAIRPRLIKLIPPQA